MRTPLCLDYKCIGPLYMCVGFVCLFVYGARPANPHARCPGCVWWSNHLQLGVCHLLRLYLPWIVVRGASTKTLRLESVHNVLTTSCIYIGMYRLMYNIANADASALPVVSRVAHTNTPKIVHCANVFFIFSQRNSNFPARKLAGFYSAALCAIILYIAQIIAGKKARKCSRTSKAYAQTARKSQVGICVWHADDRRRTRAL